MSAEVRRSALAFGLWALVAIALLGAVQRLAAERVAASREARLAASLAAVLPDAPFDNDPARDRLLVDAAALGGEGRPVYRARLGGRPVGVVLNVIAPDGYSGPLELLVGVHADGRVSAVRVVAHRETPGLGDRVERRRSDWITGFDGARARELDDPFDALSGATITSRAVVHAVRRALLWFASNRERVFAP